MSDRAQIARGEFYTSAELRARPWLARQAQAPASTRSDPNNRPVSREVAAQAGSNGVCAWCHEPGDEVSELIETAAHDFMHPECDEAWTVEREAGA